jgi:hypothetical protein
LTSFQTVGMMSMEHDQINLSIKNDNFTAIVSNLAKNYQLNMINFQLNLKIYLAYNSIL